MDKHGFTCDVMKESIEFIMFFGSHGFYKKFKNKFDKFPAREGGQKCEN
jgi:hypothetical protein